MGGSQGLASTIGFGNDAYAIVASIDQRSVSPAADGLLVAVASRLNAQREVLTSGRFNIVLGLIAMILAGITGFALGLTLQRYFQSGYAQITFWRQLTSVGHTHGMPFGMINILFGLLIGRATCSNRLKRLGAVLTAAALCLPLGTALRGVTQGAPWAKALAILGGIFLLSACFIMVIVASARQKE